MKSTQTARNSVDERLSLIRQASLISQSVLTAPFDPLVLTLFPILVIRSTVVLDNHYKLHLFAWFVTRNCLNNSDFL